MESEDILDKEIWNIKTYGKGLNTLYEKRIGPSSIKC
jgi:hypothetical protein